MAAVTICSDFRALKNKVWHCFHCFPVYFPWSDGTDAMIFVFWILSFKPTFSLSSFTFTVVLEKTLDSPLDCREIQPVHPKGIFIERTNAEAETPMLWPPYVKNQLIWKDPDAGKDWRQEEKGDNRGWDGWMASLTRWTWVWVGSGSGWWMGKPGVLQSMRLQRVGHDWATELNWLLNRFSYIKVF